MTKEQEEAFERTIQRWKKEKNYLGYKIENNTIIIRLAAKKGKEFLAQFEYSPEGDLLKGSIK